ncbi:uncharacterized protein [Miscanthus floridulus]|uniref:uncharacterized protein n=1 Tax=Miscanthus floridulus TaxID=154761 RepID=UPI003458CC93
MVVVVAAFHHRRVLPLMAQRRRLFKIKPGEPIEGIRMSSSTLSDEEIVRRVGETVEAKLRGSNLTPIAMRPSREFLSLGMRDVRASPPPVPEDARRRAINWAHADVQKKRKDTEAAKCTKKILAREELDKRRRQQRKDSLPLEESPSSSLSTEALDGDDEVEVVPGALASSPALLGGEGEADPGSAIARSRAEADTPRARALGKHAVSPVGSTAMVEQGSVEATQPPPQRTDGAPGPFEDRPVPMDTEATPLPPPPPLLSRVAVAKRLPPRSSRKRPVDELPLAPLKALKVSPGSSAHWVAEAQAAIQPGVASARADPKEPATQGGAAEATLTQMGEGVLPPYEGEAHESDGARVPLVAEAPGVSEAKATEAGAPKTTETAVGAVGVSTTTEATMAEVGAPETVEAMIAEAGAPEITKADMTAARPSIQEVEKKAAEASVVPLELETWPIGKLVFLRRERGIWDQLQWQKGLLADANELLSAWSAEVEDLRLHCADAKVEAATAQK